MRRLNTPIEPIASTTRPAKAPQQVRAAARRRRAFAEVVLDALIILGAFVLAYALRYQVSWPQPFAALVREVATENVVSLAAFTPIAAALTLGLPALFALRGLYRLPRSASLLDHASIITGSVTTGIAVLIVVVFLYRPFFYSRLIFAFAGLLIITLLCMWRALLIAIRRWRWIQGRDRERVLVVGGSGLGRGVMAGLVAQPDMGYQLAGYLDDREPPITERRDGHFRYLGAIADLEERLRTTPVEQVIIALPFWEQHRLAALAATCTAAGVDLRVAPDLYDLSFDRVDVMNLSGIPLLGIRAVSLSGGNLVLKRAIELTLIVLASALVALLSALIALAIRLDSPGPVIFRQQRVGKDGKRFLCYKFRTMVVDAEARKAALLQHNEADGPLFKMKNDPRITRVGALLRRTSLDELPQLWNVVRGEMALVGPRPPTPDEAAQYEPWHHRRLRVTPGMTGLWQVLGRSATSFDEMVRLDIYYTEHWTPGLDLRILLQTIPVVLSRRGAF